MFCENCGTVLDDEAEICNNCGIPIVRDYVQETSTSEPYVPSVSTTVPKDKKRNSIILPVISILIVIVLTTSISIIVHLAKSSANGEYQETVSQTNIINNMEIDEREKLNTFISNFAEIEFPDYDSNNYEESQLINFLILHNYANNNGNIEVSKNHNIKLYANIVQKNTARFFNKSVNMIDTDIVEYDNSDNAFYSTTYKLNSNNQYSKLSYNEYYSLAVIDSMYEQEDGTYSLEFTIYKSDLKLNKSFYSYSSNDALNNNNLSVIRHGEAVICDYYVDSINKYQLLSYRTYD